MHMESIVKSTAFMELYNQTYPAIPELPKIVSEVAQSVTISPEPVSSSVGNNGNLGKKILIVGFIGLAIYGGYKLYENYQAKKDK